VVFSTNKTDRHDITKILLKVALNTTNQTKRVAENVDVVSFNNHNPKVIGSP
jgi:cobalamin-dependent methionine synthase I